MKSLLLLLLIALVQVNAALDRYIAANGTDYFNISNHIYKNTCEDRSVPCKTIWNAAEACPTTIHILGQAGELKASGNSGLLLNESCSFVGEGNAVINFEGIPSSFFAHIRLTAESVTVSGISFTGANVIGRDLITISGGFNPSARLSTVTFEEVSFDNNMVVSFNNSVVNFTDIYSTVLRKVYFNNNNGLGVRAAGGDSLTFEKVHMNGAKDLSNQIRSVNSVHVVDSVFENSQTGLNHPALFNVYGGKFYYVNTTIFNVKAYGHAPVMLLDNLVSVSFLSGVMDQLSNDKLYDPFMSVVNAVDLYLSPNFTISSSYGGVNFASVTRGLVAARFVGNLGANAVVTNGGNFTWISNFVTPKVIPGNSVLSVGTSSLLTLAAPYSSFNLINGSITSDDARYTSFSVFNDNSTYPLYINIDGDVKGQAAHGVVTKGSGIFIKLGNVSISDVTCSGNSTIMFSNRTDVTSFDCWAAKQAVTANTCNWVDYCSHCTGDSSCDHPPPPPNGGNNDNPNSLVHKWWFILSIVAGVILVLGLIIFAIKRSNQQHEYQSINN